MSTPYTYLIGWPDTDRWYYGVRYSKIAHPSDLWVSYFTSSKVVKQYVIEHGPPPVVVLRRTFESASAAREWESRVLRRIGAVESDRFLNRSYGDGSFAATEEHLANLHRRSKGKSLTQEHRAKLSAAGRGRPKSSSHRANIAAALVGNSRPADVRAKISQTRKERGIRSSTEHMNTTLFRCHTCNKSMTKGNFMRWHQH